MMLQSTTADTALRNWYDSTTVANIGLFKNVADSIDANPQQAKEVNESIAPDNHAEENEKAVNAIYLVTWALDTFDFSPEQYEILYAIANEVPLTGGSGVYAARVMLGLHIDDDYESIGSRMANPDKTNQSAAVADNNIKLMPNPAMNKVDYYNKLNKGETGKVIIYSKIGIEISWRQLQEGVNNFSFDLTRITPGVYIVETSISGKVSDRRKQVVIK